jgi:hypothetical protein
VKNGTSGFEFGHWMQSSPDALLVYMRGQMVYETLDATEGCWQAVRHAFRRSVLLDLSQVTYMASAALGSLCGLRDAGLSLRALPCELSRSAPRFIRSWRQAVCSGFFLSMTARSKSRPESGSTANRMTQRGYDLEPFRTRRSWDNDPHRFTNDLRRTRPICHAGSWPRVRRLAEHSTGRDPVGCLTTRDGAASECRYRRPVGGVARYALDR